MTEPIVHAPASILIADDDATSSLFLKRLLTREGHSVSIVPTGDGVLSACSANPPDLVLIDLVAPEGQGFEICRRIKENISTRFIPVVIVTSQSDKQDKLKGIDAGADDFLSKPFDSAELHARIRSLVRLKRYTDDLESAERAATASGWRGTRRHSGVRLDWTTPTCRHWSAAASSMTSARSPSRTPCC